MFFEIQKQSPIWIYGTGVRGEEIFHMLNHKGCSIVGFIDKRAETIREKFGRKVITLDEVAENIKDEIVIVGLQDGVQHDSIAHKLANLNIKKILFLPMKTNMSMEIRTQYRKKYFEVLSNLTSIPVKDIPYYNECESMLEKNVIRRDNKWVLFWCDIEDIHTSLYNYERKKSYIWNMSIELMDKYGDRKIKEMEPYINLFKYLEGNNVPLDEYFALHGRFEENERLNLLEDRKILFEVYQESLQYNQSFFTDAPSVAQWNENGYFNVCDGMHRIVYFITKGYLRVPIATTEKDYKKYRNYKEE